MGKRLLGLLLLLPVMILSSSCTTERTLFSITWTPSMTAVNPGDTGQGELASLGTPLVPLTGPSLKPDGSLLSPELLVKDVKSSRVSAPNGDVYRLNRLERPFKQNMKYLPDVDILSYSIGQDDSWYYLSIQLDGENPNNSMGIDYGIEIDRNADGVGDTLIWAYPPYDTEWTTNWVQVYDDANQDSNSAGDGYEAMVFDGRWGIGDDPSLAWVRMLVGSKSEVQFAFRKSLAGPTFLVGAIADGGLKKISLFDYNAHFTEVQAGSPLTDDPNYPLKALFAVDTTCWQAFNMKNPKGLDKVCPPGAVTVIATRVPQSTPSLSGIPTIPRTPTRKSLDSSSSDSFTAVPTATPPNQPQATSTARPTQTNRPLPTSTPVAPSTSTRQPTRTPVPPSRTPAPTRTPVPPSRTTAPTRTPVPPTNPPPTNPPPTNPPPTNPPPTVAPPTNPPPTDPPTVEPTNPPPTDPPTDPPPTEPPPTDPPTDPPPTNPP